MRNKKAIVFGANGFLGLNLCYWLLENYFHVHAVALENEIKTKEHFDSPHFEYSSLNLLDKPAILNLDLSQYDLIYIFAGKTGTKAGFAEYESYIESNEIVLLNLLDAYVQQEAKGRIVFPSTRLVYKGQKGRLLDEADEKEGKTIYAINKLACEQILAAYKNAFNISYTVFRICVPYGQLIPGNYSYGTLGFMLKQAREKGEITLYGDGEPSRTFSHVKDICTVVGEVSMLSSSEAQVINIGSRDNYSLRTLAEKIGDSLGVKVSTVEWPLLDAAIESGDTMFSDNKLQGIFPYDYYGSIDKYLNELEKE